MAEIDNWIKKQLKKGYKKEQIKEGLRKAGYPQNTIDSVDSFSKKKNFNYIFCLIIAVLIIIVLLIFFASKQKEPSPVSTSEIDVGSMLSGVYELSDSGWYPLTIKCLGQEEEYYRDFFPYTNAKLAKTYAFLSKGTDKKESFLPFILEENVDKVLSFCSDNINSDNDCDLLATEIIPAYYLLETKEIEDFINKSYWSLDKKREKMFIEHDAYALSKRASFISKLNNYPGKDRIDYNIAAKANSAVWDAHSLIFANLDHVVADEENPIPIDKVRNMLNSKRCHYFNAVSDGVVNDIWEDTDSAVEQISNFLELVTTPGDELVYNLKNTQSALSCLDASSKMYEFTGDQIFKRYSIIIRDFIESQLSAECDNGKMLLLEKDNKMVFLPNEVEYVYLLYRYDWLRVMAS